MDSFRNFLIISTTLCAIIFSFSRFFINLTYELITEGFELGVREARSRHVVLGNFIFFIVGFYVLVFYIILKDITNQTGDEIHKQSIDSWIILGIITFCLLWIRFIGSYIEKNIYAILSKKIKKLVTFFILVLALSFILSIIGLIYSVKVITFEDSDKPQKSIEVRVYKEGNFIANIGVDKELKIKDTDTITLSINKIDVASKMVNENSMKNIAEGKSYYLIILNNNKFYIDVIEFIEPIKGDKINLKINNKLIGSKVFEENDSSNGIEYIIELIAFICIFYLLSMLSLGLIFSIYKLESIKTTLIKLNSENVMGKIVFKQDDFYVVYSGAQYKYIPRSGIIGIVPVQINSESKDKKIFKLILNKLKRH